MIFRIKLEFEHDLENPEDIEDNWKVVSFDSRSGSREARQEYIDWNVAQTEEKLVSLGLRRRLETGFAFFLQRRGDDWTIDTGGHARDYDLDRPDGILVWEYPNSHLGPRTYEKRQADAEGFLKQYNDWANGEGYQFSIEMLEITDGPDDEVPEYFSDLSSYEYDVLDEWSSCNYYDHDTEYMATEIRDWITQRFFQYDCDFEETQFLIGGEADHLEGSYDFFPTELILLGGR